MLHWVVSEKAKKRGGIFTPLAGVSKAHMGCLDFYFHMDEYGISPCPQQGGVSGDPVGSQRFHYSSRVSGDQVGTAIK